MQIDTNHLKRVVESGRAYLREKLTSGHYGLSCVGKDGKPKFSNEKGHLFSIFHMINALKGSITEIERTIFLIRVFSEEINGQWGYSPRGYYKDNGYNPFFVDADDTSFALRILRALDVYRPNDILLRYQSFFSMGGDHFPAFVTFITDKSEKKIVCERTFNNNLQLHPEVNANLYHCLLDSNNDHLICNKLITTSQRNDGSWQSFFYPNSYFSTLQFMSLLKKTGHLSPCFERGREFVLKTQNPNGSWGEMGDFYLSAMALKILSLQNNDKEKISKGATYLINTITESGFWKTDQIIWEFNDQDNDVWRAYDTNHVIVTSLCVEVLNSVLETIERN